jgi:tetratricopeptide (TPR) repeat protein
MSHGNLSERLVGEVLRFATPQFKLGPDLFNLAKVWAVGAPEATVFYCARTLEALASEALRTARLTPSPNAFSNLELLEYFHLLPMTTLQWAHGLRRIGNDVRHIRRAITAHDADMALLFTERWLEWFFRHFRLGRCLPSLTGDGQPIGLCPHQELYDLILALENPQFELQPLVDRLCGPRGEEYLKAASVPAILAERCLDRKFLEAAHTILVSALERFPDDLRLRQLMGLYWSRTKELDCAIACLEPLAAQFPEDDETVGILAGVHKRKWLADTAQRAFLEKSHRAYRDGWKRSKKTNTYLGINAATTALWLRRGAESRQLARDVRAVLHARTRVLEAQHFDPESVFTYWDVATLAESELLLGELAEARRVYQKAFDSYPELCDPIEVTRAQAVKIGQEMGVSFRPEARPEVRPGPDESPGLIVGVTGHRVLPPGDALRARLAEVLATLRSGSLGLAPAPRPGPLVALSALAEGADRLVARLVLDETPDGALEVVLPLEIDDYILDFASDESIAEFRSLLNRAERITILAPGPGPKARATPDEEPSRREAAYEAGGYFVVDGCAVLIAIWDGQPARGRGGTAEIVAYARQLGRPLVWVQAAPPHAAVFERMEQSGALEPGEP